MQEKRFRNQVSWMMFLLSILVIWVHSYNAELFAGGQWGPAWECVDRFQTLISTGIGQIAVPGFFMLSSYLFFRNFAWGQLVQKWKRRFFSVAVPYAAWNLLYYFGYVIATRIPMVRSVVGKEPIPFNIEEMIRAVLHYAYAPIFWYLFQLIFLIGLSPIIYIAVKNRIVGLLYLGVLLVAIHFHWDFSRPNTDALFYYSLAAYGAVHGSQWMEEKGTGKHMALSLVMVTAGMICYNQMKADGADVLWLIGYRTWIPIFLWMALSCLTLPKTKPWMCMSMFLYAIHFIILRFINKATAMALIRFAPQELWPVASVTIYILLPAIIVACSYLAARFLMRFMPVLWRILSGGRSLGT